MATLIHPTDERLDDLPIEERIQRRAYELYVHRGAEAGTELDNWLQAEQEIQAALEQKREHEVS